MKVKKYIIRIKGKVWKYSLHPYESYLKLDPDGDAAFTDKNKGEIVFNENEFNFNVVIHEVVHAFAKMNYISDTNSITVSDFEEIYANFFENHGVEIITSALHIYLKYKTNEVLDNTYKTLKHFLKLKF